MTAPVLSVLIVNWRSGALSRGLVKDLRRQRLPGLAPGEGLEFVVLDNASGVAEEEHLAALEADGARVIRSQQNSGYGAGMNLACEQARGRYVFVTNPDVMVFRGGLAAMINHLESNEHCGAAGPKGYLDNHRFFLLPPTELPSLCELLSETVARALPLWGRLHAKGRTRRAIRQWTAVGPEPVSQLPGFGFVMNTELARELGPFDPAYPFYFEDADICMRLQRRGFTTDRVPRAEMVHFFNRSAGQAQEAAMARYWVSRRLFFRRRYGWLGEQLARLLMGITNSRAGRGHEFAEVEDLGEVERMPTIDVPGHGAYLAEISVDPGFVFAAGRLDVSRRFRMPDAVWDCFVESTYYLRFLDRRSLEVLRTVRLTKLGGSKTVNADIASTELVHA